MDQVITNLASLSLLVFLRACVVVADELSRVVGHGENLEYRQRVS